MPFCSNCGKEVKNSANFCSACGQHLDSAAKPVTPEIRTESIAEKPPPPPPKVTQTEASITHLDVGEIFNHHYLILEVLHKDNEGVEYLVEDTRTNIKRVMKIYYVAYHDNLDKLYGSHYRLTKIKNILHANISLTIDVNQVHKPGYAITEYVEGRTFEQIKESEPEFFTEEYVRELAFILVDVAKSVRNVGLNIRNLNLRNIILTPDNKIKINSLAIGCDKTDVTEDIFAIGIILSQLLSRLFIYHTIYNKDVLKNSKFEYVNGTSVSMNKVLALCLDVLPNNRNQSLEKLDKALHKLKPLAEDEIWTAAVSETISLQSAPPKLLPKRFDVWFILLIVLLLSILGLLVSTNIVMTIFGERGTTLQFTGIFSPQADTLKARAVTPREMLSNNKKPIRSIRYGEDSFRDVNRTEEVKINPEVYIPPSQTQLNPVFEKEATFQRKNIYIPIRKTYQSENMILVEGNLFSFGGARRESRDNVSLSSFYISVTEVTQAEWNRFMNPANCTSKGDNLPVDNVSWFEIITFANGRSEADGLIPCYKIIGSGSSRTVTCNFKASGYRLPTEAEWEFAAKSGQLLFYSGSNDADKVGWFKDNAEGKIHPVKSKEPNAFGLFDMTGNVAEWCWDWFTADYLKDLAFVNPTGPEFGNVKVIRGGNIESGAGKALQLLSREKGDPNQKLRYVGFRLVRSK